MENIFRFLHILLSYTKIIIYQRLICHLGLEELWPEREETVTNEGITKEMKLEYKH